MIYPSGYLKTAKIWEWNSHSINPWRSTPVCGMRMIGPHAVDGRKPIGARLLLLLLTEASMSMDVKHPLKPLIVLHKESVGGIRRSSKTSMDSNTGNLLVSARSILFTTIAQIIQGIPPCRQSAKETKMFNHALSFKLIVQKSLENSSQNKLINVWNCMCEWVVYLFSSIWFSKPAYWKGIWFVFDEIKDSIKNEGQCPEIQDI